MSVGMEYSAVAMDNELAAQAARQSRAAFVDEHPYYFLSAITPLPETSSSIETSFDITHKELKVLTRNGPRVLPLRKKLVLFRDMITVGRRANNDVVIGHPSVSRFHAYFRIIGKRVELTDTGSFNGTWINESRLSARIAYSLATNDVIRFAELKVKLIDASHCWEALRVEA